MMEYLSVTALRKNVKFIVLCGEPIKEVVYNNGPFVLDSRENLYKAYEDF